MKFIRKNEVVLPGDVWEFNPSKDGRIWIVYIVEETTPLPQPISSEGVACRVLLLQSPYDFPNGVYMDKLLISPNNSGAWKLLVRP